MKTLHTHYKIEYIINYSNTIFCTIFSQDITFSETSLLLRTVDAMEYIQYSSLKLLSSIEQHL